MFGLLFFNLNFQFLSQTFALLKNALFILEMDKGILLNIFRDPVA